MKKKINLLLLILMVSVSVFSNKRKSESIVYAELLGNGILYSVNYEHRFLISNNNFGLRIGTSFIPSSNETVIFLPMHVNYLIGEKHGLELAFGVTTLFQTSADNDIRPSSAVMYRFTGKKGFIFRAGITSTWLPKTIEAQHIPNELLWFLPGVSLGYRF